MEENNNSNSTTGSNQADTLDGHATSEYAKPVEPSTSGSDTTAGSGNGENGPNKKINQKMSNTQRKKLKRHQKAMKRMIEGYNEYNRKVSKRQSTKFRILKGYVGKNIYANLKIACTVNVPEVKNEAGEITTPARSYLDRDKLLRELHLAIVILRQDRIDKGIRKKTTGRSRKMSLHRSIVAEVIKRAEMLKKTEGIKPLPDNNGQPAPTNE